MQFRPIDPDLGMRSGHPQPLPAQPTPLIGREREVAWARQELARADVRLLTLTGPAGVGKTRLALALASDLAAGFGHGARFVDLAPIADPALVVPTIARAVETRPNPEGTPGARLLAALRRAHLLLVLDNFEHVLPAASAVALLLERCPQVKVLATSRAALRLRWEHIFAVPPLAMPDPGRLPDVFTLARSPAVALFMHRARAVDPEFALRQDNAVAVAELCVRLEGLPLAIELAAARSAVLPPRAMVPHLDTRLDLLSGGPRDLPPRHQTLRAAIGWSYDLLTAAEQRLFRALSVFAGGFTLASAEAVGSSQYAVGSDDPTEAGGPRSRGAERGLLTANCLLPTAELEGLVGKSLLRRAPDGGEGPRFAMLDSIRAYGLEQLEAHAEAEVVRAAHAAHCVRLAEAAAGRLRHVDAEARDATLNGLEREHANLRQALNWAIGRGDAEQGLRLAAALYGFWQARSALGEGREVFRALLALPAAAAPSNQRAAALTRAGALARAQGDYAAARALHEEALAIWGQGGDRRGAAEALTHLGWTAEQAGDGPAARASYESSLALYRELGDRNGVAWSLTHLAMLARERRDNVAARALLEEALAIREALGRRHDVAWTHVILGNVGLDQGDHDESRRRFEAARAVSADLGDRAGVAWATNSLGRLATAQGAYEAARAHYEGGLAIAREMGDPMWRTAALNNLAQLAHLRGDDVSAHRLYSERLALFREMGERRRIANALSALAAIELDRGDYGTARLRLCEALALQVEADELSTGGWALGLWRLHAPDLDASGGAARFREGQARFWERINAHSLASCLHGLARIAVVEGDVLRAARLFGAAAGREQASGSPEGEPGDSYTQQSAAGAQRAVEAGQSRLAPDSVGPDAAAARAALGESAWAAAWAEGWAMPFRQAVAYALAAGEPARPAPSAPSAAAPAPPGGEPAGPLTARERDVAALIAQGLTNRQIAQALVITPGTARTHVEHIMGKLGLHARAQVATWAVAHGVAAPAAAHT